MWDVRSVIGRGSGRISVSEDVEAVILFTKSFGCSLGKGPTVRTVGLLLSKTKKPQATNSGASKVCG